VDSPLGLVRVGVECGICGLVVYECDESAFEISLENGRLECFWSFLVILVK